MSQVGDRVGEYVLEAKVGAGTFGEVWRARHHVWADRVVAVKVPTDPEYVRALQSEGTAIHGLEHSNIVRAINFDPYAVPPYLAMEFIPGTNLRELISSKSLTPKDSAAIMQQVLAGLAYAHGEGMVHRDIKPENVLIHEHAAREGYRAEGSVKLTDFGLGQRSSDFAKNSIMYTASIQQGSELAGTIAYMSPEQRSGGQLDGRSDLYSCGVMLFEMLTGERPAGTELPSELNPKLPKTFDDVFRRAYARLELRYAAADEFARALGRAAGTVPPPIPLTGNGLDGMAAIPGTVQRALGTAGFQPVAASCPKCKRAVSGDDQFCMHCGVQLIDHVRRCGSCGAYPHPNDKFCLMCGKSIDRAVGAGGMA